MTTRKPGAANPQTANPQPITVRSRSAVPSRPAPPEAPVEPPRPYGQPAAPEEDEAEVVSMEPNEETD